MSAHRPFFRPLRHTVAIAAALAAGGFGAPSAHAATILPASEITPIGTTVAARPELAGTVIADTLRPFSVSDGAKGFVRGTLQDRVVRSRETGTLIFTHRVVMDPASSTVARPSEWTRTGLWSVTVDADYARDGLGTVAASSAQRSGNGDQLRFKLARPVMSGESTYFHQALTNAVNFDATGTVSIHVVGLATPIVLPAYRPSGTPQPNYAVTTLAPSLRWPFINDFGQVSITLGDAVSGSKAAIWQPLRSLDTQGGLYPIPKAPGYLYSETARINNRGQVVGTSLMRADALVRADPSQRAFLFTPGLPNTTSGATADLGVLAGGTYSRAWGVNDSGQVTGGGDYPGAPGPGADGLQYAAPLLWSGGSAHTLGIPVSFGGARGINNAGQIAGYGDFAGGTYQGFTWKPTPPGGTTGIGTPVFAAGGAAYAGGGTATDVNASGVVVGASKFHDASGAYIGTHGFLWSPSGVRDIGLDNAPLAINDAGVAVGTTQVSQGALFRNAIPTKLRYFASPALGWSLAEMTDVNASEQIVGFGGTATVARTVVLLTPVRIQSLSTCPATPAAFTLTVSGTGFVPGAVVRWNGAALPTTRVNSRTLQAAVSSTVAGTGRGSILVTQPDGTQSTVRTAC